jgi:hypothetical protein
MLFHLFSKTNSIAMSDLFLSINLVHNFRRYFRFLSIVRKTIVGFLLFGSLIFNVFGYLSSGVDSGVKMCELDMEMFVENLSATFEVLKRLNGLYILIFHFTQARFRGLIKERFGNCCQRTPPMIQQPTVEIAETKV